MNDPTHPSEVSHEPGTAAPSPTVETASRLVLAGAVLRGVFKGLTGTASTPLAASPEKGRSPQPAPERHPSPAPREESGPLSHALPHPKAVWALLEDAGSQWMEDKAPRLGAALAYYTVFSLAPLLVIAMAIAGMVLGGKAAANRLGDQIRGLIGEDGARAVETMLDSANKQGTGTFATVAGVVMLLFGAAGLFGQLQDALNTVWEVQPKPGRGIMGFVRERFLSLTMVLGTAFLLLVSLIVSAALAALAGLFGEWGASIVGQVLDQAITLFVITSLFAMIYRFLPDAKIAWKDVWFGAAVTALLFVVGKFLIGLYLGHAAVASAYGAVGSMAVLLIWLYYSAQIFLFGAELTKAYANRFGSRIVPKENAVPLTPEARAEQGIPHLATDGKPQR